MNGAVPHFRQMRVKEIKNNNLKNRLLNIIHLRIFAVQMRICEVGKFLFRLFVFMIRLFFMRLSIGLVVFVSLAIHCRIWE